jgi:hypothetical protein
MFDVSLAPIFVSTVAAIAVGMAWYSKAMFGELWMREAKLPEAYAVKGNDMVKASVAAALQNFIMIYMLAHIMLIAEAYGKVPPYYAAAWVIILMATSHAGVVIWEQRSLSYFAITTGYLAAVLALACCIITLWPWA